jgi:hypothetical protein
MSPAIHFLLFITNLEDSKSADHNLSNKIILFPLVSVYVSLFSVFLSAICGKPLVKQFVLYNVL